MRTNRVSDTVCRARRGTAGRQNGMNSGGRSSVARLSGLGLRDLPCSGGLHPEVVAVGASHHRKSRAEMGAAHPEQPWEALRRRQLRASCSVQVRRPCGPMFRRCAVVITVPLPSLRSRANISGF